MTPITYLFVPATRPERIAKAFAAGAHAVIADLEDAVDAQDKLSARAHLDVCLPTLDQRVWLRLNAATSPWFEDDLALVARHRDRIAGVMLAKTESSFEIDALESAAGQDMGIMPLVESAAGLLALEKICAHPRVVRIAFGSADLARDLGCEDDWDVLQFARAQVVLHSAAAHLLAPVDGVTFALDVPAQVETDAARAARWGFGAKLCIHPSQLAPAVRGFAPAQHQLDWARGVMQAADGGSGAQRWQGQLIDRPVIERARHILQRHEALAS